MGKALVGALVFGAAIATVSIIYMANKVRPKLTVGDVIEVWNVQQQTFDNFTVMGRTNIDYELQSGTYPNTTGAIVKIGITVLDSDPSVQKTGHVTVGG